jgi:hypothetical protein
LRRGGEDRTGDRFRHDSCRSCNSVNRGPTRKIGLAAVPSLPLSQPRLASCFISGHQDLIQSIETMNWTRNDSSRNLASEQIAFLTTPGPNEHPHSALLPQTIQVFPRPKPFPSRYLNGMHFRRAWRIHDATLTVTNFSSKASRQTCDNCLSSSSVLTTDFGFYQEEGNHAPRQNLHPTHGEVSRL